MNYFESHEETLNIGGENYSAITGEFYTAVDTFPIVALLIVLCFAYIPQVIRNWESASGFDISYTPNKMLHERRESGSNIILIKYIVYIFWLLSAILFIISLYFNSMVLIQILFGLSMDPTVSVFLRWINNVLPNLATGLIPTNYFKFILIIFSFPPIFFLSLIVLNVFNENILSGLWLKKAKIIEDKLIKSFVEEVFNNHGITPPKIVVNDSKEIALWIRSFGLIKRKDILIITQGTLDALKENRISIEVIKFIILHETGHIINDAKSLRLKQLISQFTLFGYSFLTMTTDFELLEERADKFAIQQLSKYDISDIIQKDLVYIHTHNWRERMKISAQKCQKKSNILSLYIKGYKKFYDIYFTKRIITYTHIYDFSKRIKQIKEEWKKYRMDSSST